VYLHGTVRDTQHRKMSKSLGMATIDPPTSCGCMARCAALEQVIA